MNYAETLDYLYTKLPMYQKQGASAYKANLDNIIALSNSLHKPETHFKSIHIAGTNGKGSVSHLCASILQEAGYKTGLYTSPHLLDFRERIKINGEDISEEQVCKFVEKIKNNITSIQPSFFEITVAMAFDFFAQEKVDIAIIETGLGGRLDSTNIIIPEIACITNISIDHTNILGDTLEKIAWEKAGIIKHGGKVIIGETDTTTHPIFVRKAIEQNAQLLFSQEYYSIESKNTPWNNNFYILKNKQIVTDELYTPLGGMYQQKNIATAYSIISSLPKELQCSATSFKDGLKNVVTNTNLLGRWQIIQENPTIVCDTAHNYSGVSEIVRQLPIKKDLHIVWGMVSDKDISTIISLLPIEATYYLCCPSIERGLAINELEKHFSKHTYTTHNSVNEAYTQALKNTNEQSFIYIGGSTFVVADFLSKKRE